MKVTFGKTKPSFLFSISFSKQNPMLKWSGLNACLIVVGKFVVLTQLLEGSLQILTECIKQIPWRRFFGSRMLRNGFHLTGTIMRLWHGGLVHLLLYLLLQLAAGKESKKSAPCFYCDAGWIVFAFSAASSTSSTLWSWDGYSERGENQVMPRLVHRRLDGLDPTDTGGDAPLAYSYLAALDSTQNFDASSFINVHVYSIYFEMTYLIIYQYYYYSCKYLVVLIWTVYNNSDNLPSGNFGDCVCKLWCILSQKHQEQLKNMRLTGRAPGRIK